LPVLSISLVAVAVAVAVAEASLIPTAATATAAAATAVGFMISASTVVILLHILTSCSETRFGCVVSVDTGDDAVDGIDSGS
jgi:hypothetical protein